jgi:hypothetical protein
MKVMLASAWGGGLAFDALERHAARDRFQVHTRVSDPETADLILFVENVHFEDLEWRAVRGHELVRRYREKTFLYNEADAPWCVLPGLYCSMPARAFQPRRQKAFSYLYTMNDKLQGPAGGERRWLYSFVGAANHDARRRILAMKDEQAVLKDTSSFNIWHRPSAAEREERQRHYAEVMAGSRFVLCPRGTGTSSYRLFETMQMGIAPVLISDQWVPPDGPDWDSFMLRVRENGVDALPRILREHEAEALERGAKAHAAYQEWFSPEVQFHRAVEALRELVARRMLPEAVSRFRPSLEHQRARLHRWLQAGKKYVRGAPPK